MPLAMQSDKPRARGKLMRVRLKPDSPDLEDNPAFRRPLEMESSMPSKRPSNFPAYRQTVADRTRKPLQRLVLQAQGEDWPEGEPHEIPAPVPVLIADTLAREAMQAYASLICEHVRPLNFRVLATRHFVTAPTKRKS